MALTANEAAAIERIGRSRKRGVKIGVPSGIPYPLFNRLRQKGLVMFADQKQTTAMLTYPGEQAYTKLHPKSKYRIS